VLTPGEADEILGLLRGMTRRGEITVMMISHKFREVEAFCDASRAQARREGWRRRGRRRLDARDGEDDDRRFRRASLGRPGGGAAEERNLEIAGLSVDGDEGARRSSTSI